MLNCKIGDKAIIIRSLDGNEGRIVEILCESAANADPTCPFFYEVDGVFWQRTTQGFVWYVKSLGFPLNIGNTGQTARCRPVLDRDLKPLPSKEESETNVQHLELQLVK